MGAILFDPYEPHQILRIYSSVEDLLAYTAADLIGRPLHCLFGMRSEPIRLISSAIRGVLIQRTTRLQVTMYDRYGTGIMVVATIVPCFEQSVFQGCQMDLKKLCPLTFHGGLERLTNSCLLESEKQEAVQMVNPGPCGEKITENQRKPSISFSDWQSNPRNDRPVELKPSPPTAAPCSISCHH
jgi:hypothetical protein